MNRGPGRKALPENIQSAFDSFKKTTVRMMQTSVEQIPERGIPITHVQHAKNIKSIKEFFHFARLNPMTVDGLILENLIRELILKEFRSLIDVQKTHTDELKRLKGSLVIESQKLLDTSTRLKRLQDEFIQKSIADKAHLACKEDLRDIRDEGEMVREFVNQMQSATDKAVDEARCDVMRLQTQFYDRDKPFFQLFGEELVNHKSKTLSTIEVMKQEMASEVSGTYKKIQDLKEHVTLLNAKLLEAEVSSRRFESQAKSHEGKVGEIQMRVKKLEQVQGNAKENLREFKYYKEKEYRNLEKLYYKLRFEFKQVQEQNEDFFIELAQTNQQNTAMQENILAQRQLQLEVGAKRAAEEAAEMATKQVLESTKGGGPKIKKKTLLVFKGAADNDSEYSARSAKTYGGANARTGGNTSKKSKLTSSNRASQENIQSRNEINLANLNTSIQEKKLTSATVIIQAENKKRSSSKQETQSMGRSNRYDSRQDMRTEKTKQMRTIKDAPTAGSAIRIVEEEGVEPLKVELGAPSTSDFNNYIPQLAEYQQRITMPITPSRTGLTKSKVTDQSVSDKDGLFKPAAFETNKPRRRFMTDKMVAKVKHSTLQVKKQDEVLIDDLAEVEEPVEEEEPPSKETTSISEDPVTHSQVEVMKDRLRDELHGWNLDGLKQLQLQVDRLVEPFKQQQDDFIQMQQDQMKAWRRARSDMQLFFTEIKKRDNLREEYNTIADVVTMLIDLHKVSMQNDTLEKTEAEINQIKFNIMDMIKDRSTAVRKMVNSSLLKDQHEDYLNINRYMQTTSIIDPQKHRHALVSTINEKYLNPMMLSMNNEQLQNLQSMAEKELYMQATEGSRGGNSTRAYNFGDHSSPSPQQEYLQSNTLSSTGIGKIFSESLKDTQDSGERAIIRRQRTLSQTFVNESNRVTKAAVTVSHATQRRKTVEGDDSSRQHEGTALNAKTKKKVKSGNNRIMVTSKVASQNSSTHLVPPLGKKVELGLIRTETQYRQDSARPINIQLESRRRETTQLTSKPEDDSEATPMIRIEPKVNAMFDTAVPEKFTNAYQHVPESAGLCRQILTFEQQMKVQQATSPVSQSNTNFEPPFALQNFASATTTRSSFQKMVNGSGGSAAGPQSSAALQKQRQTAAQLEVFKSVATSFDLGSRGDKAHQQSAVPMNLSGKKLASKVVNKLSEALMKQNFMQQMNSINAWTSSSSAAAPAKTVLNSKSSKQVTGAVNGARSRTIQRGTELSPISPTAMSEIDLSLEATSPQQHQPLVAQKPKTATGVRIRSNNNPISARKIIK